MFFAPHFSPNFSARGVTDALTNEIGKLSVSEKIQLAETLWEQAAAHGDEVPVPAAHKRLLDARLAAHSQSPESARTLEEFRPRLARRL